MKNQFFGTRKRANEDQLIFSDDVQTISNTQTITHFDNNISFYQDIDDSSVSSLIHLIREKSEQCAAAQYRFSLPDAPPVHLHIQSYGGLVFSGFAALEMIRNNKVPIHTYVDGIAASAATFLAVAGTKRFMYKESVMLIHQLSTGFWGKYEELLDEKKNADLLMQKIKGIYLTYTNFDAKILSTLLKKDLYLDSKECLKYGLVEEVI